MCLPRFAYAAKEQVEDQARIELLYNRAATLEISIENLKADIIKHKERLDKSRKEPIKLCQQNRANLHGSGPEVERSRLEFRAWFLLMLHQRSCITAQLHEAQQGLSANEERLEAVFTELRGMRLLPLDY